MAAPGDPKRIATPSIVAARQVGQQTGEAWPMRTRTGPISYSARFSPTSSPLARTWKRGLKPVYRSQAKDPSKNWSTTPTATCCFGHPGYLSGRLTQGDRRWMDGKVIELLVKD